MQAAQFLVQIGQAGRKAGEPAIAAISLRGHADGAAERGAEGLETGGAAAGLGQAVELLLGRLDLVARRQLRIADLGGGGDVTADADQVAPQRQVIDHPGIFDGVGGRRRAVDQVGEIADAAQFLESRISLELLGHQDRFGQLAASQMALQRGEQSTVERLEEVARLKLVAQPFIGGVVIQQRAQQPLFRLDVGGCMGHLGRLRGGTKIERGDQGHVLPIR